MDPAIAQYRKEVGARERLAQRRAGDKAYQDRLLQSQDRLKRVEAQATGSFKEATEKSTEAK
jgi:hypothetical protein